MPDELTSLERAVIELSRTDPVGSLEPQSLIARWFCGRDRGPQPFANERLEALRRYAVLRRIHGQALAEEECKRLRSAGFDRYLTIKIDELVSPGLVAKMLEVPADTDNLGEAFAHPAHPCLLEQPARLAA